MSPKPHRRAYPLICLLGLVSCGGGGGSSPPTTPDDTTAPETELNSTPAAITNQQRATFSASSSEVGTVFEISLNGAAYLQVPAVFALDNLPDGEHALNVRARDAAGNIDLTPATFRWTVDTQAPDTTIATATPTSSTSDEATFTLTSTETGGTFEASIDGSAYAVVLNPWSLTGFGDGAHTISVRAIDPVNNTDPTPATFSWQIDATAPTARVVFPTRFSYTDAMQLHVRGVAHDANGVTSLRVNGTAAISSDGFEHWSAVVPLSVGDNALIVSVTDVFGNITGTAASVTVANRGEVANDVTSLAYDPAVGRVLFTDRERRALLAARVNDGFVSLISDANRGTGTVLQQPAGLVLDGARALVTDTSIDTLVAIDLATGNRTELSAPAAQPDMRVSAVLAYHAPTQRAFVGTLNGTILAIDLAGGGTRSVFSGGGTGTGTALLNIRGLTIDSSSGTPRLLAADSGAHAIIAIDLTTGNRSTVSYAAPNDPNNQVGSGPAFYSFGQLAVDATSQRVLVPDTSSSFFVGRLFSIDLATGNRTVLITSTSDIELRVPAALAHDAVGGQVYIGLSERARVFRYDVASTEVTPFVDSNVGSGYVLSQPSGILLDRASGFAALYSPTLFPVPTIYRTNVANGTRFAVSNYLGTGGAPTFGSPGNLVPDTRAGLSGKALFLDIPLSNPTLSLNSVDLVTGNLSVVASAALPAHRFMSRMALDLDNNRTIVGLTIPGGGAGSIVAMDNVTGALTTLSSLSVGGGPPMYEIGAVAPVPSTFGTAARVLVGVDNSLLAVNGSGDRNFIASGANIGSGPSLINIEDMVVDFPRNRVLVAASAFQAMQWVDLTSGNRIMASGRNPDDQSLRGTGPPLFGRPLRLATDLDSNIAYVTVMQTAILAVDLDSGDRVIMSR